MGSLFRLGFVALITLGCAVDAADGSASSELGADAGSPVGAMAPGEPVQPPSEPAPGGQTGSESPEPGETPMVPSGTGGTGGTGTGGEPWEPLGGSGGVGGSGDDPLLTDPPPPLFPEPVDVTTLPASPDNPPECPDVAPENPVGDCLGLPVYLGCQWGNDERTYTCICDWYHWLCI
jgi:hypothetical protein